MLLSIPLELEIHMPGIGKRLLPLGGLLVLGAGLVISSVPAQQPAPLQPEDLLGWWMDDSTETSYLDFPNLDTVWVVPAGTGECSPLQWEFVSSTEDSIVIHAIGPLTQQAEATIVFCSTCSCTSGFEVTISVFNVPISQYCIDRVIDPPLSCGTVAVEPSTWGKVKSRFR